MSRKRIKTKLEGYDGPVFPEGIDQLNTLWDEIGGTGVTLEEMGETIKGFKEKLRPTTADGYCWFWGLGFQVEKGEIIVVFPWRQDWDKNDGVQLDRSIAFYTKGEVDPREIAILRGEIQIRFLDRWTTQVKKYLQKLFEKT